MEQFSKPLRWQFYNSNERISTMEKKAPNITKKQLVPFIREAWNEICQFLAAKRKQLGNHYNWKNDYERITERFGSPRSEPEKFFDEFMLCLNKASKQPASVRIVIEDIGRRAVDLYLKKEKQRKQQKKEAKTKTEE